MILRSMPAISNAEFRRWFYTRWGLENCVIAASTRNAEYPLYKQRLSIKAAWGGHEDYFVDGRRIMVDDDTFVILNDGHAYSSVVSSATPVVSFSIFFRPGMVEEVARAHASSSESLIDDPSQASLSSVVFAEHVRPHDRQITPALRFIRHHVDDGVVDESWYEEQLYFLLERMLMLHTRDSFAAGLIPAVRASTRKELFRRIGLGVNFINTYFARQITLAEIAGACVLSPYHCLRTFKSAYGKSPTDYLNERRIQAAGRLLRESKLPVSEIAAKVGFTCRTTLFRRMKDLRGIAPTLVRRRG